MVNDQWMTSAMTDDALVVELLLRLKQSHASPSHVVIPFPVSWGLRQPRSRIFPSFRCEVASQRTKKVDSTRCSPSTPLSWSGGLSSSPASDASEDSSHLANFSLASPRSKDTAANASAAATNFTIKRSRKRKTLMELKREEGLLLEDIVHLEKESETLHGTFKEHTANNKSFKRMKLNLNLQSSSNFSCISAEPEKWSGETDEADNNNSNGDDDFLLPDLNMMPCDVEKCDCL